MPVQRPQRRQFVLNLVLVFVLGLFVAKLPQTLAYIGARPDPMGLVEDVHALVLRGYVEPPDDKKLAEGAINGMLESLDDPYAEFIPAEDAADFEKAMTGAFSGIGAQIETKDGFLHIVSPLEDSPAWQAGILAGDKVTKIDGTSTAGLSTDKCIKLITGEPGTSVHLDVLRDGKELAFDIVRAKIVSKSVRGFRRKPDASGHWDYLIDPAQKVAYVRMSQFTPTSPDELFEALDDARKQAGAELGGLILDLRFNPGGLMDAALEICDHFLDSGTIMSTRGRAGARSTTYQADADDGPSPTYPIAVIVNGSSASASEIVAGCLQENSRAVVIGARSYGKGLVQGVQPVPSDPKAQVKFTIQRYYLPSGRMIQRTDESAEWGVDPSPGLFVPMSDEDTLAWLLLRRDWDVLRKEGTPAPEGVAQAPAEQRWTDPAWVRETAKDRQLAAAVQAMSARLATSQWPALSEAKEQHARLAMAELKTLERTRERMGKEFARLDKRVETLEHAASVGAEPPKIPDFWSDSLDLTGGSVEVRDKDGKVVAELKVTGRDLERWLSFADVRKAGAETEAEPTKAAKVGGPAGTPTP